MKIYVTKTFLPPIDEYERNLKRIWKSGWITNRGNLVQELEQNLLGFLGANNIIAMANGTMPLHIAIKGLGLKGEIITTPFSYVATTSSIVWEGCKPVFVDIHPEYLTIDENKIEAAITEKTSAILATHVFGNPCNVIAIQKIADRYGLKVIYDAAHSFGVKHLGQSIFNYGNLSTCSFHATKIFHTGEGGALFFQDKRIFDTFFYYHNFGHDGQESFKGLGTNAKMSELQAAMGLSVLPHFANILNSRKEAVKFYNEHLKRDDFQLLKLREQTDWNYSYFPIIFKSEKELLRIKMILDKNCIYTRRYFYPSLNNLPYVEIQEMPISESVSKKILCLPLFYGIEEHIDKVTKLILKNI